ncbi:MAG: ABC transporter permease [Marinilabiliales bacterium]|nr:MAG: ABC transporter permease [Marinilabiliales bacterium]
MNILQIFRSALRALRSDLKSTIINIVGLAGGLTVFLLIMLFVNSQYTYNTHISHAGEIFRLERGFHGITNGFEAERLASRIPEIESYSRAATKSGSLFYRTPDGRSTRVAARGVTADSSFIDMFDIKITEQSVASLLRTPTSILISEDLALQLFGSGQALGELVSYENRHNLMVEGIFEPLPPTSTMNFDMIIPIDYLPLEYGDPYFLDSRTTWMYETYFRLNPDSREVVKEKIIDEVPVIYEGTDVTFARENVSVELRPLRDIYFADISGTLHRMGDKRNTFIFLIIAGFVLIIAAINFVNLSTAQSARRSKETGLKKILGAGRSGLISQICAEGVVTIFISILIALALAELLMPWYTEFVDTRLGIEYNLRNLFILIIAIPLLLGSLSGIFPAFFLSRISPLSVLRKELTTGKGGAALRSFLTVFQFSISIFLIVGTLVVNRQLRFINSWDPGFETENIIELNLNDQVNEGFEVFKQTSLASPAVQGITRINQRPYQASNVWSVYHGENNFTWPFMQIDEDFAGVFGLTILQGEDFSEAMVRRRANLMLVNEKVIDEFETDDILSETPNNYEIVGVVNNFHSASLRSEISPVTMVLSPSGARGFSYVRLSPDDPGSGIEAVRSAWEEVAPDYPFEYNDVAGRIDQAYISEKRFGELFTWFSLVSILISCLGLFALASYTTASRIKEIAIRKVHGATSLGVGILLSGGLTKKVLVANLVAWPAAWFFMNRWLENFAYRIDLGIPEFLLAGIIAQVIALATVSWHVYTTSLKNPANTLKYE